jgi:hypothetical protein
MSDEILTVPRKRDFWAVYRIGIGRRRDEYSFFCHAQAYDAEGACRSARQQMGARGKLSARRIGAMGYARALESAGFFVIPK